MVGTARVAERLLYVALHASQLRLLVRDYGMPASQSGKLHHHSSLSVRRCCGPAL